MKVDAYNYEENSIGSSLKENLDNIKNILGKTSDLLINEVEISGHKAAYITCEAMVSTSLIANLVFRPLINLKLPENSKPEDLMTAMNTTLIMYTEKSNEVLYKEIIRSLLSGFLVILVDGVKNALLIGAQGYEKRGIDSPTSETNLKGSHEGFTETIRVNVSLIRRKMKSPLLMFDMFQLGKTSKTDVVLAYLKDRVPEKMITDIKKKLDGIKLETILSSGYIEPFLAGEKSGFFGSIGSSERPDKICSKLLEGRVAMLIDGTPFVLIIPHLFIENFQTVDDYNEKPYYATFIRALKYIAFMVAILLPGVYVAIANFHPELINNMLLINLVEAEKIVPFPLALETIIVLISYELIREAGLRLPEAVGGTVSIVGGFIIGDAAVKTGLISTPLLIAVAFAVTASLVIPNLNDAMTILRLLFVIAGALGGLYAIALLLGVVIVNASSIEDFGVPITAPVSPLTKRTLGDIFTRQSFKKLQSRNITIEKLNGVNKNG